MIHSPADGTAPTVRYTVAMTGAGLRRCILSAQYGTASSLGFRYECIIVSEMSVTFSILVSLAVCADSVSALILLPYILYMIYS